MMWLLALALAVTPGERYIQFNWTQGVNPGWTSCTTGKFCLTGYTLYETTSGTPVALVTVNQHHTSYNIGIPAPGQHTYQLVQNGLNGSGQAVQSSNNPTAVVSCTHPKGSGRQCTVLKQ
jgi:hypothetical protein